MNWDRATDAQLVEAFRLVDRDRAFEEIIARYGDLVTSICRSNAATPEHAEDAAQETFLALHRRLPTFEGGDRLGNYLARTAKLTAQDRRGTARRTREVPTDQLGGTSEGCSPEDLALNAVLLQRVFDQLPTNQRQALVSRHALGMTRAEIAAQLDTTEGYVAILLHRGSRRARDLIGTLSGLLVLGGLRFRRVLWSGSTQSGTSLALPAVVAAALVLVPAAGVPALGDWSHADSIRSDTPSVTSRAAGPPGTVSDGLDRSNPASRVISSTANEADGQGPRTQPPGNGDHLIGEFVPDTTVPGTGRTVGDRRTDNPDYRYRVAVDDIQVTQLEIDDEPEAEPAYDASCDVLDVGSAATCTRDSESDD